MRLYHRTPYGTRILAKGFRDGVGTYLTNQNWRGAWFSAQPVAEAEGAKGMATLRIEVPIRVIRDLEWVEEGKPYREWLIPAKLANQYGPPTLHDHDLRGFTEESLRFYLAHLKAHNQVDELREYRRDAKILRSLGWIGE